MANPSSDRNETIIRSILFIAVVLLAVGIIIFLKRSSDVPLTPEGFAARDSAQRMATPDTTRGFLLERHQHSTTHRHRVHGLAPSL